MSSAFKALLKSRELKKILFIILNFGNYMNTNSRFGDAVGFQIEVLSKMNRIKATDRKMTLLRYIMENFEIKEHDFLELSALLSQASRNSSALFLTDLRIFADEMKRNAAMVF